MIRLHCQCLQAIAEVLPKAGKLKSMGINNHNWPTNMPLSTDLIHIFLSLTVVHHNLPLFHLKLSLIAKCLSTDTGPDKEPQKVITEYFLFEFSGELELDSDLVKLFQLKAS